MPRELSMVLEDFALLRFMSVKSFSPPGEDVRRFIATDIANLAVRYFCLAVLSGVYEYNYNFTTFAIILPSILFI